LPEKPLPRELTEFMRELTDVLSVKRSASEPSLAEGIDLVRSFMRIADPTIRGTIVSLVKQIATLANK
jgi:hypothetical protein